MSNRKPLTKKIRFEVFKRDSFTCQYCGRSAPDVILHVDHIKPVSKDGDNEIFNLITSCFDCNMGKKDRELSDNNVLSKRKQQLDELQERREQIDMMFEWQKGLSEIDSTMIDKAKEYWAELTPGYFLNETGISNIGKWIRKYGFQSVLEAIKISTEQYLIYDNEGNITKESIENAYMKIPGICYSKKNNYGYSYYLKAIIHNRFNYINEILALQLIRSAIKLGIPNEDLKSIAVESKHWTDWREKMQNIIDSYKTNGENDG